MRALIALLFVLPTSAGADVDHEVSVGSHVRALRTSSANALTDDSLAGPTFGYAYRLPFELVPKLELWATGNILFGFGDGEMFQTLTTEIESFQLTAGVRVRYPLWRRFVVANVRVDAGAQENAIAIEDMSGHTAADRGWGALATAALGVELNALARRSFALGIRLELGYVAAQGIGLTARSEGAPEDTIELDRMAASIGHLDLGGRYFSLTCQGRF